MQQSSRIKVLAALGEKLKNKEADFDSVVNQSCVSNPWFTPESVRQAVDAITTRYLNENNLYKWSSRYNIPSSPVELKTIGLVMAGNVPLVGFHDFLCVFVAGHKAKVKLSGKDALLFPFLINLLKETDPEVSCYIDFAEQLNGFDAVIATGSNNSARYFEYYFGKYPHIIRKNRSSAAILTGNESSDEIQELGKDIFQYFGLGCRNVSKLFVPVGYDFPNLLSHLEYFADVNQHNKYKNNFDYYYSIFMLNGQLKYASDFLVLQENKTVASPVGVLHYEYYYDKAGLYGKLMEQADQIQCVVASPENSLGVLIPFGQAQLPNLWDYADGVDTMQFLSGLYN
ncbi:MAG: acyl-CoA reductase [Sphingobacteriales bacterium]|nr:MAG: acyl-CoA reductase [Sphingobacteriales bacterium]